jgi:hypothetical protein
MVFVVVEEVIKIAMQHGIDAQQILDLMSGDNIGLYDSACRKLSTEGKESLLKLGYAEAYSLQHKTWLMVGGTHQMPVEMDRHSQDNAREAAPWYVASKTKFKRRERQGPA